MMTPEEWSKFKPVKITLDPKAYKAFLEIVGKPVEEYNIEFKPEEPEEEE